MILRRLQRASTLLCFCIIFGIPKNALAQAVDDEDLYDSSEAIDSSSRRKSQKAKKQASERSKKKLPKKATAARGELDAAKSEVTLKSASQAYSFREMAIAVIEAPQGLQDSAEKLVQKLRAQMPLNGFRIYAIPRIYGSRSPRARLNQEIMDAAADSILVGELSTKELALTLFPLANKLPIKVKIPVKKDIKLDSEIEALAAKAVEQLKARLPYEGFIVSFNREAGRGKLNIGSNHGIGPQTMIDVFDLEFRNRDEPPAKIKTGSIQIVEILGGDQATFKVESGREEIELFQKVAVREISSSIPPIQEPLPPTKAIAEPPIIKTESQSYFGLGAAFFSMKPEQETSAMISNAYSMSPGIFASILYRLKSPYEFGLLIGRSKADPYSVSLTELRGIWDFYARQSGSYLVSWGFGIRVATYNVGLSAASISPPKSSIVYGFMLRPKVHYDLNPRWAAILALEICAPLLSNISTAPFTFGAGPEVGLRWQFSKKLGLEASYKMRIFRRAVDGNDSVIERDSQPMMQVLYFL